MINPAGSDYSPFKAANINIYRNSANPLNPGGDVPSLSGSMPSNAIHAVEGTSEKSVTQGVTAQNTPTAKGENSSEKSGAGVLRPGQAIQSSKAGETTLSAGEQKQLQKLKETDRKVRQHEMAHLAASGGIAVSGANFQYQRGPDGVNYAIGGDVKIDTSRESTPQATINKAQRIVAAALAPADPSPQDRSVAASARQMEAQARMEQAKERTENIQNSGSAEKADSAFAKTQPGETTGQKASPGNSDAISTNGIKKANSKSNYPASPYAATDREHPGIEIYRKTQQSTGAASFSHFIDMSA